jgi:hypothetical protein
MDSLGRCSVSQLFKFPPHKYIIVKNGLILAKKKPLTDEALAGLD